MLECLGIEDRCAKEMEWLMKQLFGRNGITPHQGCQVFPQYREQASSNFPYALLPSFQGENDGACAVHPSTLTLMVRLCSINSLFQVFPVRCLPGVIFCAATFPSSRLCSSSFPYRFLLFFDKKASHLFPAQFIPSFTGLVSLPSLLPSIPSHLPFIPASKNTKIILDSELFSTKICICLISR